MRIIPKNKKRNQINFDALGFSGAFDSFSAYGSVDYVAASSGYERPCIVGTRLLLKAFEQLR